MQKWTWIWPPSKRFATITALDHCRTAATAQHFAKPQDTGALFLPCSMGYPFLSAIPGLTGIGAFLVKDSDFLPEDGQDYNRISCLGASGVGWEVDTDSPGWPVRHSSQFEGTSLAGGARCMSGKWVQL